MTFIEEVAVPLSEVAKRAGLTLAEVRAEASALNMFVGEDWKHQEALSAKDAFVLLDGSARRNLDRENAWHAHNAAVEQWQAERENVRRAAFDAAWAANVKRGYATARQQIKRMRRRVRLRPSGRRRILSRCGVSPSLGFSRGFARLRRAPGERRRVWR